MFPKKNISGKKNMPRRRQARPWRLLPVLGAAMTLHAGEFTDSLFRTGASAVHCAVADSITVAVRYPNTMRMEYGPVRPNRTTTTPKTPDVVVLANNRFRFFWTDSVILTGAGFKVYRRDLTVVDTGVVMGDTVNVAPAWSLGYPVGYLHADASDTNCMTTVIEKNAVLKGYSGRSKNVLDSIGGPEMIANASQCRLRTDTFMVIYTKSNQFVKCKKVYFSGNPLAQQQSETTIAANQFYCINPTIAADSSRNILALWMQGPKDSVKRLTWAYYDSNVTFHDSATLSGTISDKGLLNYYDESPVVSYARNKFASVSWDLAGIVLHRFEVQPALPKDTVSVDNLRLPSPSGSRFPTIASNGRYVAVIWREGAAPGAGYVRGIRYPIVNGTINTVAFDTIINATLPSALEATDTVSINCSMDSSGNMGVCWQISHYAQVGALASRNILFDSGSWTSTPLRLQAALTDSFCIDSASVFTGARPTGTAVAAFLGIGADSTTLTPSVPFGSSAGLAAATKGVYTFLQCKVSLAASPNLLKTPTAKRLFVRWNAKPRIDTLLALQVNGAPARARFSDTITCMSRMDTVTCRFRVLDGDGELIYSTVTCRTQTAIDSFLGLADASSMARFLPLPVSDSVYGCTFHAHDKRGWAAQDSIVYIKTRNSLPLLRARAVSSAAPAETLTLTSPVNLNVKQSDSVEFIYSLRDTNDPGIKAYLKRNGATVDSTVQGAEKHFWFRCSSGLPQGDQFMFSAADADTSVTRRILCGVNHFPAIDSLKVNGVRVRGGDTVGVVLGSAAPIAVFASDADVGFWDTLTYSFRRATADTATRSAALSYIPSRFDTSVTVVVSDVFGIRDSLRFFIKFPWYATDSASNARLFAARKLLQSGISLIVGGGVVDTIVIPILNTGNDSLVISSVRFTGSTAHWLRLLIPQGQGWMLFDSLKTHQSAPILCPPDSAVSLLALFCADSLHGDDLARDSIMVVTNDPIHARDTLPVRLEYNDLPRIAFQSIDFIKGKPFWLSVSEHGAKKHMQAYVFPPHAKLSIHFSEPMDSVSAVGAVTMYSVFDSLASGSVAPIPLVEFWSQGRTCLSLSPRYNQPSSYFHVRPPDGLFIPTDSLRFIVTSGLTDTAKTPSGPNNLDVHKVNRRIAGADTVFSYRVDSISYALTAVFPDSAATGVAAATPLRLTFSSPPLPGTVDTSKINNRSLVVRSVYAGAQAIAFSRVSESGDTVTFVPAKRFFYGDTVYCRYRAATARDSMGYPVDIVRSGVPPTLFDSISSQGDKVWYFVVKNVAHASVYPMPGAAGVSPDSGVRITFDDTLRPSAIDSARTGNRTLIMTSRCSGGAPIAFASVTPSPNSVLFKTARKLYYGDSVHCSYRGLSTVDTALYAVNGSPGAPIFTKDKEEWAFAVKNIERVSVSPESCAVSSSIHPEIVLTFSDPVYPGVFDTDTSGGNRSFKITSTFSKDTLLPFKSIVFSAGGNQVRIRPQASFFSSDSVHCTFSGFLKTIGYDAPDNLPAASAPVTGAYAWPFFIQNAGFYTYPNPYKPGSDPRHCAAGGPCGVWFKNLHTLKRGVHEVAVTIFSMDAHPLYSTKTAAVSIRFAAGNADLRPEWKWDTRNQHGSLVASGLYLYAVFDMKDNVLIKGKLMIVR